MQITGVSSRLIIPAKTTASRRRRWVLWLSALLLAVLCGCRAQEQKTAVKADAEEEAIARTEFTERMENFFEYEPLKAGKPSQFRIHLTDLRDGSPVEQAEVTLSIRAQNGGTESSAVKAKVGKVTGIYIAEVAMPKPGAYDIEFHVKNTKLDERMPLANFKVEKGQ
jgi:5-hydroxyisourate hydrolase-like protein (transthyretin family)